MSLVPPFTAASSSMLAMALLVAGTGSALAQTDAGQTATAQPLWELGGVSIGVSQQAYPGADQQVNRALVLPFFLYRGEVVRADRETAGIRAIKSAQFEVDIGFAGSFGSSGDEIEARRGMRDLGTLVEFGPRLKWHLGAGPGGGRWRAELPLRGVFDISDGAANRGVSFEPRVVFERQANGGWRYSTSIGAIVADAKLARTFYEVSSAEATAWRPAYGAKGGLVAWRLGASATYSINPDWRIFGFARVDSVAGAANASSPLVRSTTGASVGFGVAYIFMRSQSSARD